MSITLYEIAQKFRAAMERVEAAETEAEYHDAEAALLAIDSAKDDKLEACVCHLKNLRASAEPYRIEIERLQGELERLEKAADRFTNYVRANIEEGVKWCRNSHSISWRKSEAVKITDQDAVPSVYLREVLRYEADRVEIKKDLKCGATIPGCELEIRQNLVIK